MSALTPKDCNAELSSEEAPPLLPNTNIIIHEHLVEPKDDFILYDSDGEDFSLFTDDYSDYCGPIGTEGMGYPGEYKLLPEYGQIQVGKPNNEKS
ncbi:4858_t:CDS:2 [Entrophospora sp. SA101]|nr:4858_t:CDS:2 [Entrophospora sp. SA101]CAJ0922190.1 15557_t:CDS:2 [Entrophospora sp. SA101]